ncbi:MAG: efflux RND transporter periplasmic adaptor subunit [Bdellovibrionaceae bacterium]|nr:efflux RND transporter periplasmic adaptor subunit [Pseudobdellovibrionaceae bacterium]
MSKRKYIILGFVVVAVIAGFIISQQIASQKINYKKFVITKGDLEVRILATGTVQPQNRLEIKSPVAGRIEEILVDIGDMVKKGQILGWISSTERAALLDAAHSKGEAEVKRWKSLYKPTPIMAPIDGQIILRNVENGQTFTVSDAVLVMSNRLTVKAQVDETDLAQIKLKQNVEIRLDAYPDQKISAQVEQIAYEAKTVSNVTTYIITVLPRSTPDFMRSGMTANLNFAVDSKKNILLVPNEFIKYENGKALVSVESPSEAPTDKELKLGVSDGKQSEVISGLEENNTILLVIAKPKDKSTSPFSPIGKPRSRGGK